MKLSVSAFAFLALVLTRFAAATASAPAASLSENDYKFREAPLHSLGIQSLDDLRGKPIVIDFWGKN